MYFDSFAEFITMGGHGPYVWACYAIALVVIVLNIASPLAQTRAFMREQARRLQREQRKSPRRD